ncbi:MAG: hypothetical protein ABI740_02670 [Alphaproteobacteria bacterium]
MSNFPVRLSRRQLALGLVATALIAPAALASETRFPLRVAYARIGKDGFIAIRTDEQSAWSALQTRLGGLVDDIQPIQPGGLLGVAAPEVDGAASCAVAARKLAAERGFSHVILYATLDGKRTYGHGGNWLTRGLSTLRSDISAHDRASGEAYLLDVSGGVPLASATADAKQKEFLDPFDDARKPERETLVLLTRTLETQLQRLAAAGLAANQSIADR